MWCPRRVSQGEQETMYIFHLLALLSNIIDAEPSNFEEVMGKQVWKDAMDEDYQSIMKNDVRDVVPRPEGKSVVTSKWIYNGNIGKYKARFMARGFVIDYEETIVPMG